MQYFLHYLFWNLKYLIAWFTKIVHESGNLYVTWPKPIWKQLFFSFSWSILCQNSRYWSKNHCFFFSYSISFMLYHAKQYSYCKSFKSWKFYFVAQKHIPISPSSGTYYQHHHNWTMMYPRYYFDWFETQTQQDFQNGQ